MGDTLSHLPPSEIKRNNSSLEDSYAKIIAGIREDPTTVFDPQRCSELAALKLSIPERIKTLKYSKRQLISQITDMKEQIQTKEVAIALEIASLKDDITGKSKYKHVKAKEAAELKTRSEDKEYLSLQSRRKKMVSLVMGYEEEIEYLERIDASLLEILALVVAQLESYGKYTSGRPSKSPKRSTRRVGVTSTREGPGDLSQ